MGTGLLNPELVERALSRAKAASRFLPWISLVVGAAGAVLMDRSPGRVWMVVVAASLGWGLLVLLALLSRLDPSRMQGRRALFVKAAGFVSLLATQSLVQIALLFPAPFYARAATWSVWHASFLLLLAAAAAISLWDPWYAAVTRRPLPSFLLQAFAVFVGTNAVLPVLGLSNRASLAVAGIGTAVGAPLFLWLTSTAEERRVRLPVAAAAAVVLCPALLLLGAARLVPPAPLELVRASFGTSVVDRELVDPIELHEGAPASLVCFTAIKAPLGLKDALVHVWRKDGEELDRIPLEVAGGREEGFRTWSKKRSLGADPAGAWTCSVETASGQILGRARLVVR